MIYIILRVSKDTLVSGIVDSGEGINRRNADRDPGLGCSSSEAKKTHKSPEGFRMSPTDPLSAELTIFDQRRAEWVKSHPGEYVVIQDNTVLPEFFGSYADALKAGLKKFGASRSFLVMQIWKTGPVHLVS